MRVALVQGGKFWQLVAEDHAVATFWGKTGTIGRSLVNEYPDSDMALAAAEKLVRSKYAKGYEDTDSNLAFTERWYIDDPEAGLHRLTSHPRFVTAFPEDQFFDCTREDTPFGSDTGNDTLDALVDEIRKKGRSVNFAAFPEQLVCGWDMPFRPPASISLPDAVAATVRPQGQGLSEAMYMVNSDQTVVGAAFGQVKITGDLDPSLGRSALVALHRLRVIFEAECSTSPPTGQDDDWFSNNLALAAKRLSAFLNVLH